MKTSCCHSKKIYKTKDYAVCGNSNCENYMRPVIAYSSRTWNNIFLFFFFIFIFILSFNDFSNNSINLKNKDLNNLTGKNIIPLTEENLRKELEKNHIICPDQVFAQIMIESGNLKSFLSKRANNIMGMRFPVKRTTSAVGIYLPSSNTIIRGSQSQLKKYKNYNNYAVYECWEDCIKDYKYWQEKSFKLTERYLIFLGNYYAEDSLYVAKIKKMTNKAR